MLKKLLIAAFVVLLIVVGLVAYAVYNAGDIIASYKPTLERMASDSLGSDVTLGSMEVSIFPSARVKVDQVQVVSRENPDEKMTFDNVALKLQLLPLLYRKVQINTLSIAGPSITVYLEEGGIYLAGLPRSPSAAPAEEPAQTPSEPQPAAEPAAETEQIAVNLDSLEISNALLRIIDRGADTEYEIKDFDATASLAMDGGRATLGRLEGSGIMLSDVDFNFEGNDLAYALQDGTVDVGKLQLATLGNTLNIQGQLAPEDASKALSITSDQVKLASLEPIYDVFAPIANDMGLTGTAKPDLSFALAPAGGYRANGSVGLANVAATFAESSITELTGDLTIDATESVQKLSGKGLKAKVEGVDSTIDFDTSLDAKQAKVEPLRAAVFEGTAEFQAGIGMEDETFPFTAQLQLAEMDFGQMVQAYAPDTPVRITGTLTSVNGNVSGTMDENMLPSVTGTADLLLSDGLIRDVNLGSKVLGAVDNIPFLSGTLLNAVPESVRNFVSKDHTVLESVSGSFDVAEEKMATEDLSIVSDFFSLDAQGTIGFDMNVDLDSVIHFNQSFSQGMVGQVKELSALTDADGRMSFPVRIKGIPPDLSVTPDVGNLLEQAVKGTIREQAEGVVKDLLGGDKEEGEEDTVGGLVNRVLQRKKKDN